MINILIADDEPIVRQGLNIILKNSHVPVHNIIEAANGREAIQLAKHYSPQVVILDIKMPGCSGLEAMKFIRQTLPDSKIIILSAYNYFEYAQEALRYGAFDYLVKPVQPEGIVKVVCRCLKEFKQKNNGGKSGDPSYAHQKFPSRTDISGYTPCQEDKLQALMQQGEALAICYELKAILQGFSQQGEALPALSALATELLLVLLRAALEAGAEKLLVTDCKHQALCKIFQAKNEEDLLQTLKKTVYVLASSVPQEEESRNSHIIRKVEQYINENIKEPLTLADVAQHIYLSPAYFSTLFKQEKGENFSSYVNRIRIKKAKVMLAKGSLTQRYIAQKIGFSDACYFSRVFKKFTGLTPGEYRQKKTGMQKALSS